MSFNKVILIGNVGKDPEVRHLPSGGAVANFSLATSDRARDKSGNWIDQTEWHAIVCWGSNADVAERFIRKGTQIMVEWKIRYRKWQDQNQQTRYTTEIVADNIRLLGKKADNPASNIQGTAPAGSGYQPAVPQNGGQQQNGQQQQYSQPQQYGQAQQGGQPQQFTQPQQPTSSPMNFADEGEGSDDLPF